MHAALAAALPTFWARAADRAAARLRSISGTLDDGRHVRGPQRRLRFTGHGGSTNWSAYGVRGPTAAVRGAASAVRGSTSAGERLHAPSAQYAALVQRPAVSPLRRTYDPPCKRVCRGSADVQRMAFIAK